MTGSSDDGQFEHVRCKERTLVDDAGVVQATIVTRGAGAHIELRGKRGLNLSLGAGETPEANITIQDAQTGQALLVPVWDRVKKTFGRNRSTKGFATIPSAKQVLSKLNLQAVCHCWLVQQLWAHKIFYLTPHRRHSLPRRKVPLVPQRDRNRHAPQPLAVSGSLGGKPRCVESLDKTLCARSVSVCASAGSTATPWEGRVVPSRRPPRPRAHSARSRPEISRSAPSANSSWLLLP